MTILRPSDKVSRDAQEILEAGLRSADSGQFVTLPVSSLVSTKKCA